MLRQMKRYKVMEPNHINNKIDEHDMTTIDSRIRSFETTALPPIDMLLSVNRPFLSPQLDSSQSKHSDYYNKSVSELNRTHHNSTTKDDHTSHSLKNLGQQLHQIASLNSHSINSDQVESSHIKNTILLPQHEYRKKSDERGSVRDVSASLPVSKHPTEYDFNEIIKQCSTIEKEMKEKIKAELDDSISMNPWLDDMITAANKILNALLRLRKRQMTMESSIQKQHMEAQHDEKNIEIPKTRKRRRSHIQGRCHSCNISETPEWRRGPNGARTLCNACGLHYAKLAKRTQNKDDTSMK